MKNIIIAYLFCKAMINARFDLDDIFAAFAVDDLGVPDFVKMIAAMNASARLPEARADILYDLKERMFPWLS